MFVRNIQIESSLSEFMSGNTLPTTIWQSIMIMVIKLQLDDTKCIDITRWDKKQ